MISSAKLKVQGRPKNWLFQWVGNFATVNGRKVCDMLSFQIFVEKAQNLLISAFKYSLPSLRKFFRHMKLCLIWQKHRTFTQLLNRNTRTCSEGNSNDHLHTELVQTVTWLSVSWLNRVQQSNSTHFCGSVFEIIHLLQCSLHWIIHRI